MALKAAVLQAWHSALYQRLKKLPELRQVLAQLDGKPPRKKTSAEIIHFFEHMNRQLGGRDLRKKDNVNV